MLGREIGGVFEIVSTYISSNEGISFVLCYFGYFLLKESSWPVLIGVIVTGGSFAIAFKESKMLRRERLVLTKYEQCVGSFSSHSFNVKYLIFVL